MCIRTTGLYEDDIHVTRPQKDFNSVYLHSVFKCVNRLERVWYCLSWYVPFTVYACKKKTWKYVWTCTSPYSLLVYVCKLRSILLYDIPCAYKLRLWEIWKQMLSYRYMYTSNTNSCSKCKLHCMFQFRSYPYKLISYTCTCHLKYIILYCEFSYR